MKLFKPIYFQKILVNTNSSLGSIDIQTEILESNNSGIHRAAQILDRGGLVAFPTETVYGLGADATNAKAIERLYQIKQRPKENPLIIHVFDQHVAEKMVHIGNTATKLSSYFWPGPLTMVLNLKVNNEIKLAENSFSKLKTLGVRSPGHPITRKILRICNNPIAAPSANVSGKLSTTRFEDVLSAFYGKIDAIVDGGPCPIGVESTILKVTDECVTILRPGGFTQEEIEARIGTISFPNRTTQTTITAPGQFNSHYCPDTPLRLDAKIPRKGELLLAFGPLPKGCVGLSLSEISDLNEAAMNLYSCLADLDHLAKIEKSQSIAVNSIPNIGLGIAINDRLKRAAEQY